MTESALSIRLYASPALVEIVACMLGSMNMPPLLKQKTVWIPTAPGWVLALAILFGALFLASKFVHPFLSYDEPAGAQVLVVEGWMPPEELDQAVALFQMGKYKLVITTGGPITSTIYHQKPHAYAPLAREYLIRQGIPADAVVAVPAPASAQDRTYLSAVMVRFWLAKSNQDIDLIDLFSSGLHARRSRELYRLAFGPAVTIGIISAKPSDYDPAAWWTTSIGAKTVITELISWFWTMLLFNPGPKGSREEQWGPNPAEVMP